MNAEVSLHMEPLRQHTGIVVPLDRNNIDTDQIIPKQFLKRIERTGFGEFLFWDWRMDEDGTIVTDFVLNQSRYESGSILVAGANFGSGSSREHAPWALLDYGFKVIIAPSFADIFYNNCFKNGVLPITLPREQVDELFRRTEGTEGYTLTVDLEAQRITDDAGLDVAFEVDPFRRQYLLEGMDDIGITLQHEDKIAAYERRRGFGGVA